MPTNPSARQASIINLPFVRNSTAAEQRAGRNKRIFWSVKPTGDWQADCETGERYGLLFLAHMVAADIAVLNWVVEDMPCARDGVQTGFHSVIARYAMTGYLTRHGRKSK